MEPTIYCTQNEHANSYTIETVFNIEESARHSTYSVWLHFSPEKHISEEQETSLSEIFKRNKISPKINHFGYNISAICLSY